MYLLNSKKEIKSKIGARYEPATSRLLAYPSTDWATRKVNKFGTNENYYWKVMLIVYFEKKHVK